jgi:NAD(P)H-hydrate epimerase
MLRLTREQVREIDRRAIEEFHIPGIVLMENAARAVADVAWEMLGRRAGAKIAIICGKGNNGGDGYAVARHLHNRGAKVGTSGYRPVAGDADTNYRIAEAMGLTDCDLEQDLFIDALFGTGLTRAPAGMDVAFINAMNHSGRPILAIDVPSGLDCNTGEPLGACVRATHTVTFVAEKAGFANPASKQFTGEITIGDIGCPRELIEEVAKS